MDAIDVIGNIAEIISWIGLGLGLPLLLVVLIGRAHDGRWMPMDVVFVVDDTGTRARWFTAGDFWERPLRAHEAADWSGHEEAPAFVSERHPQSMHFEPRRPGLHAVQVLGITLGSVGAAGLLLSIVLLFVR
jgi:hypothetical protein